MEKKQLIGALEAALFVSGEPVALVRLEKILDTTPTELAELLTALQEKLEHDESSGLRVIQHAGGVSLVTKGVFAPFMEQMTKAALQETLSRAALEVLAIIAYRAPIARSEIEAIRGVNCSFTLRNLLLRDLIERIGNPQDSRGYLYQPTFKFLQSLGISSIVDLPDFETLKNDERLLRLIEQEKELTQSESTDTSIEAPVV
ncbi:MAG: SMC-Scp complex subunit ScpB [Candidatus Moranbacteria bacterium]|jgi:segregation and condensation protein B|nr:SMC-Scp complex subunit ScpB [Candidatus Moranbacteria bacterium]MBP9801730.1 SMC-Scp complex subunit ScpB [Candidatus Moranbacteria bacterium]